MVKTYKGLSPSAFNTRTQNEDYANANSDFLSKCSFFFPAVDGFLFLMLGTALYNELLIIPPLMPKPEPSQQVT